MENENIEEQDSLNPESEDDTLNTYEEEETSNEETEEPSNKEKELAQKYENQKIRAEKAEQELKKFKREPREEKNLDMDIMSFIDANVTNKEDIQIVKDFCNLKKISVDEALKSSFVKSYLSNRKEERTTAEATSTGNKRSGVKALSDSEILQAVDQGKEVPAEKLAEARYKSQFK